MNYLSGRVNPGIGTARAVNSAELPGKATDRRFENALHGSLTAVLQLKTGKVGSVILDGQPQSAGCPLRLLSLLSR